MTPLDRTHLRGMVTVAVGVLAGLVVFGGATLAGSGRDSAGGSTALAGAPFFAFAGPQGARIAPVSGERESLVLRSDNRGQVFYGRYCDSCHPGGNENLGASLRSAQFKRTFNTPEKVTTLVRRGGFDMPAYPKELISDADLAEISSYVISLPEAGR